MKAVRGCVRVDMDHEGRGQRLPLNSFELSCFGSFCFKPKVDQILNLARDRPSSLYCSAFYRFGEFRIKQTLDPDFLDSVHG